MSMMKPIKKHIGRAFGAVLALAVCASGMAFAPIQAHAEDYTYMATFYAGNHGKFTTRAEVRVNNSKSDSGYYVDRAPDGSRITVRDLKYGDVVRIDVAASGAVDMDPDSLYYVKGLRDSGLDNAEAGYGAFVVRRDEDFVVAYGMKAEQTSYTVYYKSLDGEILAEPRTYWGNVGDKPVAAYLYVEGYEPLSYNLTKTLSEDPADNDMTFLYKKSDGQTVTIRVPGPVNEVHVPGGTTTVTVPGPTIVQNPSGGTPAGGTQQGGQPQGTQQGGAQQGTQQGGQQQGTQQGGTQQGTQQGGQQQGTQQGGTQQGGTQQGTQQGGQQQGTQQGGTQQGGQTGEQQGGTQQGGQSGIQQGGEIQQPGDGNISGTGTHGQRPGEQQGGQSGTQQGDTGSTGSEYKPGGSLDVVISSDYQPSDLVDLDENPSGVPLAPNPDGSDTDPATGEQQGTEDGQGGASDPAADGMNENTDGTGTGTMEPEKKGLPIVPIAIGAVVLLGAAAGGIFFAYKKQQGGGDDDGEDGE